MSSFVSGAKLAAHLKHGADIVPVPSGGCPRSLLTATSGGRAFTIALTGEAESPAGDPVATCSATIKSCWTGPALLPGCRQEPDPGCGDAHT